MKWRNKTDSAKAMQNNNNQVLQTVLGYEKLVPEIKNLINAKIIEKPNMATEEQLFLHFMIPEHPE